MENPARWLTAVALLTWAATGAADDYDDDDFSTDEPSFVRIATFANYTNNADISDETVSEIVAATLDGRTLVYTDGELEAIGFVDITNPRKPTGTGKLAVGGEPTSVAVHGNRKAFVGVNTSTSFVDPSGDLLVVDIVKRSIERKLSLGGQPDSVAVSPDGRWVAVAIENERDEEICTGGSQSGAPVPEDGPVAPGDITEDECEAGGGAVGTLPQTIPEIGNPPGYLAVVDTWDWSVRRVDLRGLSAYAPEDPEPEFVDINHRNEAVVTLQENNHVAIVDLRRAEVVGDFDMGAVTLEGVDAVEDDIISLTDTLTDVAREPDAVTWVPRACGRRAGIATANEGDLFGGSRGFTIFCRDGRVRYDSDVSFEELAVRVGHYPEGRSENKGSEPEAIEYARFGHDRLLFVASERGSFVGVYDLDRGRPVLRQALPAPLGPEGLLAIPSRNLLVVSGEVDDPSFGVRSTIMIYKLRHGAPDYPQLRSVDNIGWSAMSGLTVAPGTRHTLLGVWDSFYAESNIFTIDVSERPAVITRATTIRGASAPLDPEGIAAAPDGTLWIASEGDDPGTRANLLVQVDPLGNVLQEVGLPQEIEACRLASTDTANLDNGFEGVAILPGPAGRYRLLAAQQLPWFYTTPECSSLDDEPGFSRVWIYDPYNDAWDHVAWELEPIPANASWVGLSEITRTPRGYVLIERDNRTGDFAGVKNLALVKRGAGRDGVVSADEKRNWDMIPDLEDNNGWISDKPEGLAVTGGWVYLVTDNDGVDDWSGETWFLELGPLGKLFSSKSHDDDDD